MDIPSHLVNEIRDGKVVLVLGAGASLSAAGPDGRRAPTAAELGGLLSDRYLGGRFKDKSLSQISELAICESDLRTVQDYIRTLFEPLEPTAAHRLVTQFSWWGLATTNYDCLMERAYETASRPVQVCVPYVENGDRVADATRASGTLVLIKLYGCITRTANSSCPLILTTDQYIDHRKGRSRLFERLKDWAYERTVLFVGHGLQDPDLRAILLELTETCDSRPRYYAVAPHFEPPEERLWEQKRITALKGTFDELMTSLDAAIPASFRVLAPLKRVSSHPISERFAQKDVSLSQPCAQFLETDVEYVNSVNSTEALTPSSFYRGRNEGWSAVEQNLDVRRGLADAAISEHFLIPQADHLGRLELIAIKGHAGAGKSILLRRIAWDAARDYGCLCLYMRPRGVINTAALQELIRACRERIYLFVDDAADRVRELQCLANNIKAEGQHLTVFTAERINEWNVSCESLSTLVTDEYELGYLSSTEIDALLLLLEKHRALGTLQGASAEDRRKAFAERAGRQLLVALHEATLGKPFEEIIEDEFENIQPFEAQRMYLTICTLNRLNVRVRAGIISRLHNIRFEDFHTRLFAPLEHVVQFELDHSIQDYTYAARHHHIADIVFMRLLRNAEDRYDLYLKCLQELNLDYTDDNSAFWQMVRGRTLLELFPKHEMARGILEAAKRVVGLDPYLLHQMALYEMHRPQGRLDQASDLLARAAQLAPHDYTIKHSTAELRLRSAEVARTELEREKLLNEASTISNALKSDRREEVHGFHTSVKIGLKRLKDALQACDCPGGHARVEAIVRDVERNLSDALQRFPGDTYLLAADAELGGMISDSERVLRSLQEAFSANPRTSFLGIRLARNYIAAGDLARAKETLQQALNAKGSEQRLNYEYVKLLMLEGNSSSDELRYHLQRSFVAGDTNYEAQLLYGRQLFVDGARDQYKAVFRGLSVARIDSRLRDKLRYPLEGRFSGRIEKMESNYCFIAQDGSHDWIYTHRSNVDPCVWSRLAWNARVTFAIAFNFRGASASEVQLEANGMHS